MKRLFHGTTFDNYQNILKNGFGGRTVWHCSDSEATYGYDASKFEDDEYECISNAFSNAQVAAATHNYAGTKLVVLELHVDDKLVYDDESCPGMADIASVVDNQNLTLDNIKAVYISEDGYNPALKLFYISWCWNKGFWGGYLTALEKSAIKQIVQACIALDELRDIEWQRL